MQDDTESHYYGKTLGNSWDKNILKKKKKEILYLRSNDL